MSKVTVNMGNAEADTIQLLPDGAYDLRIIKTQMGEAKKSGHPMVTVDFEVVNNPYAAGKKIMFHNVTIIPNDQSGAWIAKLFLKAIGQPYKGNEVTIDSDAWLGKIINAEVGVREYEGKKYNQVISGTVKPYEGPAISEKAEEDVPF